MNNLFSMLASFLEMFIDLIPRFLIVKKTHAGVSFKRGKHTKIVPPGFHLWWPFWTEIELYPTVRQTMNLPQQTLTTRDREALQINTVIVYKVADVHKMLTKQYDIEETIRDLCLAAIADTIGNYEYEELLQNKLAVDQRIKDQVVPELLNDYGVNILKVKITDFAKTRVLTLSGMGEYSVIPDDGWE